MNGRTLPEWQKFLAGGAKAGFGISMNSKPEGKRMNRQITVTVTLSGTLNPGAFVSDFEVKRWVEDAIDGALRQFFQPLDGLCVAVTATVEPSDRPQVAH
jgi:hypothetical protein